MFSLLNARINKKTAHPTLIFAENHEDPILGRVLLKLLPKLKALNYSVYLV